MRKTPSRPPASPGNRHSRDKATAMREAVRKAIESLLEKKDHPAKGRSREGLT